MYGNPPPPPYAKLETGQYYGGGGYPSPHYRNIPRYPYQQKSSCCGTCFRCICCCCCFLFFLLIVFAAVLFIFYHIYQPRFPNYKVETFQVKSFDMQPGSVLNTEFEVVVRAENPNKHIAISYGKNGWVHVSYADNVPLCSGQIPSFYQGKQNTTMIKIETRGKAQLKSDLENALKDSQKKSKIPLHVMARIPVSIHLGKTQLREIRVLYSSTMELDSLSPNTKAKVAEKDTKIRLEY